MENDYPDIDVPLAVRLSYFPCIWDRKCQAFKDVRKKREAFEVLAAELKVTPQFVASRYKALREKYRKEKIKIKKQKLRKMRKEEWDPLDEIPDYEPWPLMKNLSFLDRVMVPRKRIVSALKFVSPAGHQEFGMFANYSQDLQGHGSESTIVVNDDTLKTESEDLELQDVVQDEDLTLEEDDESYMGLSIPHIHSSTLKDNDHLETTEFSQQNIGKIKKENEEAIDGKQSVETTQQQSQEEEFDLLGKYLAKSIKSLRSDIRDDCIFDINKIIYKYKKL